MSEEVKEWILQIITENGTYETRESWNQNFIPVFAEGAEAVLWFEDMLDNGAPGGTVYLHRDRIHSIRRIPVEQEEERVSQP